MSTPYKARSMLWEMIQRAQVRHCCRVRPDELKFAPCTVVAGRGGRDGHR
jgi:hypothetical protein